MADSAKARPRLTWPIKILFAVGAMANGVKYRTLGALMLIFYNQVLGMSPAAAAGAIFIVTICDAFFDPLIGQVSDNIRSRWGRRHPFMYISALPMALSLFMLFNPPAFVTGNGLFFYLLICLLSLRFFDTFYDVPAAALVPELTPDYNDRTTLIGLRQGLGLAAGLIIILFAYQVFMKENPDGTGGVTSRAGYFPYSLLAAGVMFVSVIVSSVATHHMIPFLSKPPERPITFIGMMREMLATLNNRAFLTLAGAILVLSVGTGLRGALEIYFYLYFWGFTQAQISVLAAVSLPGSLIAAAIAPVLGRTLGKKQATMFTFFASMVVTLIPVVLRVTHVLPPNGSNLVFGLLVAETFVTQVLLVAAVVLSLSMLADVVEEVEVRTGRRSEGLLMCGEAMMKKMTSGVGVFLSGVVLTFIHFPKNAKTSGVAPEVLQQLGVLYIPLFGVVLGLGVAVLAFYNIDRDRHDRNLETLKSRAG